MQVVVLGAGYAGVTLCRRLERRLPRDVELTLVDERDTHLVQHELHRVVRRPALAEEIQVPLDSLFDRTTVRQARVRAVDCDAGAAQLNDAGTAQLDDAGTAQLADEHERGTLGEESAVQTIEWDVGAVCLGVRTADFGLPGVLEYGHPLKRVDDALAIHEAVNPLIESGEGWVVVGGAGLTGIQVAGELAAWASATGAAGLEVRLLEQESTVAPGFPTPFQEAIADALDAQGVMIETGVEVVEAATDGVDLADGRSLLADELVWTGGIRGSDALGTDRPSVRADLRLGPDTFGVGDAVNVVDGDGAPVPATAQAAVAGAKTAAVNVARRVEYHRTGGVFEPRLERFRFDPRGWVVSVGDEAVALVGGAVMTGAPAALLEERIGVAYREGAVGAAVDAVVEAVTDGG